MRKILLPFIFISFLLSNKTTIDLITTNDMHGSISEQNAYFMNPKFPPTIIGAAGFYEYVKKNTNSNKSLIFDAGNFFQGHPISEIDNGQTIINFMNKVGYTAAVPGPYDFIYGAANLNNLVENAEFPFIVSNLECNDCDLISENFIKFFIKEIDGVKFGVLGIIDSDLSSKVLPENIVNIEIKGVKESLDYWVPKIKKEADVVIVLTSSGIPWDREEVYNDFIQNIIDKRENDYSKINAIEMGYFAHDVDLIVSGGFSKGYQIPWEDPNSGVHIIQNYGNGTSFGHLSLNVKNNKYIGSTDISVYYKSEPNKGWTGGLGVLKEFRRKGIATAIKIKAIEQLLKKNITEVRTDNEKNNPMYKINVELGFKPVPFSLDYSLDI